MEIYRKWLLSFDVEWYLAIQLMMPTMLVQKNQVWKIFFILSASLHVLRTKMVPCEQFAVRHYFQYFHVSIFNDSYEQHEGSERMYPYGSQLCPVYRVTAVHTHLLWLFSPPTNSLSQWCHVHLIPIKCTWGEIIHCYWPLLLVSHLIFSKGYGPPSLVG